jgi:hypothetical protein
MSIESLLDLLTRRQFKFSAGATGVFYAFLSSALLRLCYAAVRQRVPLIAVDVS